MSNTKPHENLYNALNQQGYDIGDLEQFTEKLKDAQKRRALFDTISTEFNVGDFDNFENTINYLWNNEDTQPISPSQVIPQPLQENIAIAKSNPMDKVNPALRTQSAKPIGDVQASQNIGNKAALTFKDIEPMPEASEVIQRNAETLAGLNAPTGLAKSPDPIQQAISQDIIGMAASQEWQRDTLNSVAGMREEAKKKIKERAEELRNSGEDFDYSQWQQSPSKYGYAPMTTPGVKVPNLHSDREMNLYRLTIETLEEAQKHMETVRENQARNGFQQAAAGVGDALFDIDTLTLGLDSLAKNATLKAILDKADADQPLTQAEESLLNAALYKQFTEAALPNGRWYNVGKGIGEQVPYMLEFALSGGVAGALTKGASKAIGKQVVKYINNLALKNGSKIAKRTARNLFTRGSRMLGNTLYQLPGGVMRAAVQVPLRSSVYNDIIERQIGTLGYNPGENGTLDYTGRIDADNTADAITKGLTSGFITNLTESVGGEGIQFITNKIGGLMGKGANAVFKNLQSPRWYNRLRESFRRNGFGEFVKATSWQGPVAEYGEEILDQTLNAIFVGDSSLDPNSENYVFDLDNLIDTAITTGVISLFMGAAGGLASGKIHRDVNKAYALAKKNIDTLHYTDTEINALNNIATSRPQEASKWVSSITRTMRTLAIRSAEIENSLSPEARTLLAQPYTDAEFNELSPYDQQAVLALEEIKYRFNDLSMQRDYVVAGINYNALSKGLKESVAPQAEAAMADIQANALRDSDYTVKVTFRGQDGYLVSGTAEINDLPDGRTVATLPAGNIYQVRTKSPDGQWIIQQAVAEDIVPGTVTPTQQLIDETTARIYTPVQNLINAEQAQAQAEVAQSTERTTPITEQPQPTTPVDTKDSIDTKDSTVSTEQTSPIVEQPSPTLEQASPIVEQPTTPADVKDSIDSNAPTALNGSSGSTLSTEAQPLSTEAQPLSTISTQAKLAHIASWQQAIDVPIVIFHDISEVDNPQAVANIQAGNRTPGWFTDDTVYIYLPHAIDERDIDATIMHECIAHFGIPRLFATQEQADAFYDEVWNAMPEAEQRRFLRYPGVSHLKGEDARRAAADEYIAHLAEQIRAKRAGEAEVSLWQRIVAFFRNALRRAKVNLRLNDTDLTQLLLQSLDALKKNNEQPKETTPDNALDANEVAVTLPSNGTETRFSIRSFREEGRAKVTNWLNRRVKSRRITKQEAQDILDQLDTIYDICQEYTTQYAPFGDWSEAQVNVDANGNPVLSVIKSNGEYAMNLDFSLVCKKRRTLDAVFQEMIARDIINDFELDGVQVAKVNEIIRSYGFETACRLCFVDAKRFRIAAVADTFVELFNEISSMSDRKLRQVIKEEPTTVRGETAQLLLNDPSQRIKVSRSDFMSAEGFERIKRDYPEIMKLYNAKKGTGGPKASFGDVQYLNEIENRHQWTPNKAYSVGGVRLQSFSDYVPRMVFDYVQMIADLAAKRLPVHAYTKEDIFAKQFGLTGIKINLSLVPRVDPDGIAPGLDRDGNYVWQEGETFPYDIAIAIQNAPGYRDNCGTIAVGVSDAHILKMLDDENIRMVIPYHKSGLNPAVAIFNNIDAFVDYTNEQNTRYNNGTKLSKEDSKNHFNFNEALRKANGNPRIAAQQYLDWCRENNYLPKFDKFASHPNYYKLLEDFTTMYTVDGVDTVVPQHAVEMRFPTEQDAFGSMRNLIAEGLEADAILEGQRNEQLSTIVDEIAATLPPKTQAKTKTKTTDTRFSSKSPEEQDIIDRAKANGTYLLAPNGQPTNLTPRQWVQVRTRAFKEWFGDWESDPQNASKIVDENGEPMVATHYSPNKFTTFDTQKIGSTTDYGAFGRGFYFSPNMPEFRSFYGNERYDVYLNIKNPLILDDVEKIWQIRNDQRYADNLRFNSDKIQSEGYDGTVYINEQNGKILNHEIIAFSPNQIKSATDNIGTFDSINPDIRFRSVEDLETIYSAVDRFKEQFKAVAPIVVIENTEQLRKLYADTSQKEFNEIAKTFKEASGMYDPGINKIIIFAENSNNAYTELLHENTHAAIYKLYRSNNLDSKFEHFIKDMQRMYPDGNDLVAEYYSGDEMIDELVAYTLSTFLQSKGIDVLLSKLSSQAQQEISTILNTIGYEKGRKQHTPGYAAIFATRENSSRNSRGQGDRSVYGTIHQESSTPALGESQMGISKNERSPQGKEPITSFRSINPDESLSDYARAVAANGQQATTTTDINAPVALATANDKNKLPDTPIRFRMTRRTESTVTGWINRRTDLTPDERKAVIDHIDNLDGTTLQLATAKWFAQGTIRIPEDNIQVEQAIKVASRAKVDPLAYDYPQAIISAFPDMKPKGKPINPDDVPTLTNKQELPNGLTVYTVDESRESQQAVRDIINTHLGTRANPWCITSALDGNLTDESWEYWESYSAYPKRIAFHDGKVVALFASDSAWPIWWDTQDRPHYGIPLGANITDGEYNEETNTINTFNEDGEIISSTPADTADDVINTQSGTRFRVVDDADTRERFDREIADGNFVKTYRSMVLIDGELYPPMFSKTEKGNKSNPGQLRQPSHEGDIEQSEEDLSKATLKNGKYYITLIKDNNKETRDVAYNPYLHTASSPLNDQFKEAQDRHNMVTVEMYIPLSELTSGYQAEGAHDPVGWKPWPSGILRKYIDKPRKVLLTQRGMVHRIVPDSEVASLIDNDINGNLHTLPTNVFTPSVRAELEKLGYRFINTNNAGKITDGKFAGLTYSAAVAQDPEYFGYNPNPTPPKGGKSKDSTSFRSINPGESLTDYARAVVANTPETRFRVFGGNSGYVGYSMSKRAEQAREEGRYPKTDFKRIYGITDKMLTALVESGIVSNNEWHHTSKFGNKTTFYGFENRGAIDFFNENKDRIKEAIKNGTLKDLLPEFQQAANTYEQEEIDRYNKLIEEQKREIAERNSYNDYIKSILPEKYTTTNDVTVYLNGSKSPYHWKAEKNGFPLSKRHGRAARDKAFETTSEYLKEILPTFEQWKSQQVSNNSTSTTRFRSIAADNRTADYALDTIEQATADYADTLNTERQAIIDAITPAPDDSLRTIAEKTRLRSIGGELITRDNTELEDFLALANNISNAMADNDARHKHTAIAESQYDSMQRLHNLIDDLRKQGALIDERFDPWLTQNQARSRAQAETKVFDLTYRQPLYEAIARGIRALFPGINTKDKAENAKGYSHLSLYAQARTAVERQAIKSAQARAEAEEKGEEYKERDFGGLAGIQEAIFGLYSAIDNDVEAAKGNIEKLTALATERGIPTVQEYINNAEAKLGNPDTNGTAANQLWTAIRSISAYQLTYSYNAGLTSRAGYQTLTYGRNIDALLREKYDMQVKQIKDNPGSYDNVTDYDKDGNATGTRKVLNDNARIALNQLNQEYAEAIDAVPMPGKNGNWQHLIDTGWLTEEDVNSLHRYYMFYMPLKGHAELTAEDIVEYENKTPRNQSKIKAVEGHSHLAKDPFNQLILDTHGAIQNAEQNRWRLNLYNILTNNPNPSQYVVEQRFYKIETQSDGSKEYVPYGELKTINGSKVFIPGRPTAEELANGTAVSYNNRFTRAEVDIPISNDQRKEHSVTVMVDGEAYSMFFYDKRIADAINGTNIKRPSDWLKYLDKLQALNRLYAGLKTSLNPTFTLISNLPRDWMEMVSNNLIEHGLAHAVTSFIYRVRATRAGDVQAALRKYQDGKLLTLADATTDVERYVVEFFNNGGSVNITQLPDYNTAKVELMDDLNTYMRTGEMPKGSWLSRNFNNMAERVELAPRLATYIASRTLGRNISQSVNDAKEATVNFDRKGSWSGIMGMFQLFYNAAAQSVRRQIGLARRHPVRFAATYATIGLLSPLNNIMMSYIMSMLLGDDDDLETIVRNYFAINPELRRRYNIILIGNDYIRIPMAVNYLPYVTLGDAIANWRLNPNYRPNIIKDTLDIAAAILDTFLPSMIAQPIGFMFDAITAQNNVESANAWRSFAGSFGSTGVGFFVGRPIEPLMQAFGNYNFMGSTLFDMPYDKNSQEPAYLRARQYTQPVWVWASHLLNDITGGNEVHAGWLNIAPEQIENVMTVFGGYGEYAENFISLGIETVSILSGEKPDTEVFKKSFPLLSRLYGGNTQERYDKSMQSMFYDDTTALAGFNEYRKNATTPSTRADFDRTYSPDEQRYFADLNTMESIAKKIRKEIKAATPEGEAPKYHEDERLKAIYNLANEQYHSLASGQYKPIDNPYYTFMYIKDAIEKAPHRTTDGTYRLIDRSERSADSRTLKQLLQSFSETRSMYNALPSGYYPGMTLDNREEQALNRFNIAVGKLIQAYQNTDLDNLTPADNAQ